MSRTHRLSLAALVLAVLAAAPPASAQRNWNYQVLSGQDPFAPLVPQDINNAGTIVGYDQDLLATNPIRTYQTFVRSGGAFTFRASPTTGNTFLNGINNPGQAVGHYYTDVSGTSNVPVLRQSDGTYINLPTIASVTAPQAINDNGLMAGWFSNSGSSGLQSGYITNGVNTTTYNFPGREQTVLRGLNNAGVAVGYAGDIPTNEFPVLLTNGVFTDLSGRITAPNIGGSAEDINERGQIAGYYLDPAAPAGFTQTHGFLLDGAEFVSLDVPDTGSYFPAAVPFGGALLTQSGNLGTQVYGLNDRGDYVGRIFAGYNNPSGAFVGYLTFGFAATAVPEPGSIALFVGMAGTGLLLRRRARKR